MEEEIYLDEPVYDLKGARKGFSRIGLALAAILATAVAVQALAMFLVSVSGVGAAVTESAWFVWLMSCLPMYLVAFPTGLLLMRKLPSQPPEEQKLGGMNGLICFLIAIFLMYTGSIVGTILSAILSGGMATNAVADMVMDNHPLKVLFVVILAPVLEEYVFRKQLLDRTRRYGEKTAALLSAVTFGLLHQNLYQFFYAFALGFLMAYIYLRTGRLRYSAILHTVINFMGSVLAPWMLKLADTEAMSSLDPNLPYEELLAVYAEILPGLLVVLGYSLLLMGLFVAGLVMFIIKCRSLTWLDGSDQLPRGTAMRTVYWNVGMVIYMLLCLVMIVLNLF